MDGCVELFRVASGSYRPAWATHLGQENPPAPAFAFTQAVMSLSSGSRRVKCRVLGVTRKLNRPRDIVRAGRKRLIKAHFLPALG